MVAGTACATETFAQVDPAVVVAWSAADGDLAPAGTTLATVQGSLASILTAERTALNFLGHLSGIATLTRRYVVLAAAVGDTRIWDTRKTTPGLRSLEKAAVRAGGGANHRGNLSDWILLKDNHLARLGIATRSSDARSRWPGRTVHVECDDLDQLGQALDAGVDAVLLDNMSPDEVREAVALADAMPPPGGRRPLLEVSGGITLDTVGAYAALGADLISVGGLTNSAPVLDIGLDLDPEELNVLLAIDAGNTETVVGLYDLDGPEPAQRTRAEDGLVDHWRIATEANRTSDELAVLLAGFLSFRGLALDDVDGLAVSSGVPRVKESLRLLSERYLDFDPVMIEPGVRTGIAILAENPKEVGADRIANAVAAFDLFGGPTIVVRLRDGHDVRRRVGQRRVPGRGHRPGHRDQHGRAGGPGRPAAGGRAGRAPQRAGQEHGRVHPVGGRLRLRRAGGRAVRADPAGAGGVHHRVHRGPGRPDHPALVASSTTASPG